MPFHPLRLLQIAPRFSGCPTNGAEQRTYSLGVALAKHMAVTHIGFSRPEEGQGTDAASGRHRLISVPRAASYRPIDLLRGVFGPVPFSVLNYSRREMGHALEHLLGEEPFDFVLLEAVQMGNYLPVLRRANHRPRAIVSDWHNIESEVLHRYAETEGNPARRLYARHAAYRLASYERQFVEQCDLHVTVSERDREAVMRYGAKLPVLVIENGVDVTKFPWDGDRQSGRRDRFRVVFVGAMDYHANADVVREFAVSTWPEIHRRLPEAVFTVVGRNPGAEVRGLAKAGIEVTGTVPDVRPYYREAFAAVVPLRVAGGTRIKILEAMAAGVPVISTARGAEGLAVENNVHYLLAETAGEMREAVFSLAGDRARSTQLAAAGRELVERRYDWAVLGEALAASLLKLAGESRA